MLFQGEAIDPFEDIKMEMDEFDQTKDVLNEDVKENLEDVEGTLLYHVYNIYVKFIFFQKIRE